MTGHFSPVAIAEARLTQYDFPLPLSGALKQWPGAMLKQPRQTGVIKPDNAVLRFTLGTLGSSQPPSNGNSCNKSLSNCSAASASALVGLSGIGGILGTTAR